MRSSLSGANSRNGSLTALSMNDIADCSALSSNKEDTVKHGTVKTADTVIIYRA